MTDPAGPCCHSARSHTLGRPDGFGSAHFSIDTTPGAAQALQARLPGPHLVAQLVRMELFDAHCHLQVQDSTPGHQQCTPQPVLLLPELAAAA